MRPKRFTLLLAAMACLLILNASALAAERVALVVGNAGYDDPDARLRNPVNDATAVAAALRRIGFEVIEGRDLDEDNFYDKIAVFENAANAASVTLFFYAGHGLQVDGRNYLAPIDMRLEKRQDLRRRAIELAAVLEVMRSETNLVILDACRTNPLARNLARALGMSRAAAATRGLARVEKARGTLIAFATEADDVADDGEGAHSPYTAALLEHLETPGLSVQELFTHVAGSVEKRTGGRQRPWTNASLSKVVRLVPAVPVQDRLSVEHLAAQRLFWESVKDSTNAADLQAYLDRYPGGTYEVLARNRLEALRDAAPGVAPGPKTYRLTVRAMPADSTIRIMNINAEYSPGMELQPGRYDVLVERQDYESVRQWIVIDRADVAVDITLPGMTAGSGEFEALAMLQDAIGSYAPQNGQVDYARARRLFEQAADTGHPLAVMWLARNYAAGRAGFVRNEERAQELARGVIQDVQRLAREGDREACFLLGSAYDEELAVRKDHVKAVSWYRKAADQGHALAQNNLGAMYMQGLGVAQSDREAVKWYRKAAEQGHTIAQRNMGWMYMQGLGVAQSDREAVKWLRQAAEQGDATAQRLLGYMYDEGLGVEQSDREAVKWYRKAAAQGDATAQNNLGLMYSHGRGVPESDREAVKWYRQAAEQGYATAQYNLGLMYRHGLGVEQSHSEAVKWYRKAADQGHTTAQDNLAEMGQ